MYRLEIQLTPEIHEGEMKHYWHIYLQDGSAKITVKHGWNREYIGAMNDAWKSARNLGI